MSDATVADAFREIDSLAERMLHTGARSDEIELAVVDANNHIVNRPGAC